MTRLRASLFGGVSPLRASLFGGGTPSTVFAAYLLISLVMTWPLAAGMTRDVPGDLGDSLLNMWILGWGAKQVPQLLTGQIALADYWNANIFHPEPLALSFSEHLFGEVLQILPLYWLTGNLILCYNLLFISSFALSGLGVFLLVRDLLGERSRHATLAAFVAGVIFAFIPFRIAQVAHIQALHAQWMPLALFAFRRFITTGRISALVGGAVALLMQNWSNGYYLLFFAPFVPVFVLHQMWLADRLRDGRAWAGFAIAAVLVFAGTWPFLALYLEAQRLHGFERLISEVIVFSADVYAYLTAPESLRLWGGVMRAFPKPEGELFFGFVPWGLFFVAVGSMLMEHRTAKNAGTDHLSATTSVAARVLLAIIVIQVFGIIAIAFTGGFVTSVGSIPIRATNSFRLITTLSIALVILLGISPSARQYARNVGRSPLALFAVFVVLSVWLSLGPMPQSRGRNLAGLGLYSILYEHVPGFTGLRVPARFAMLAALFLSVAAGFGTQVLLRRTRRSATVGLAIAAIFLSEAWFAPMPINVTWGSSYAEAPARVFSRSEAPAVYHQLATLPDDVVVAEFPFGDVTWELRYVYYSTVHWKRLVNGYSGAFPHSYTARVALLQRVQENPDAAWRALRDAGTTHVVVHERAFRPGEAAVITKWLADHFAVEIARFDGDLLFDVTGVWPPRYQ